MDHRGSGPNSKVHPGMASTMSQSFDLAGKPASPATSLTSAEKSSTARDGSHFSDGSEAPFSKLRNLTAFVPPPVLHRFIKNPQPLRQCEVRSYKTSVLFADISGYSELGDAPSDRCWVVVVVLVVVLVGRREG